MRLNKNLVYNIKFYCNKLINKEFAEKGIKIINQAVFSEDPSFQYNLQDDILYWKKANQVGSLQFINDSRIMRGYLIDGNACYKLKACAESIMSITLSDDRVFNVVFGSKEENGDIVQYIGLTNVNSDVVLGLGTSYEKKHDDGYHCHIRFDILPMTDEYINFGFLDFYYEFDYETIKGGVWKSEEDSLTNPPLLNIDSKIIYKNQNALFKNETPLEDICSLKQLEILANCKDILCVEELYTLPKPIVDDVNNAFPNELFNLMLHSISDEQLKYLNLERPAYTKEEINIANDLLKDKDIKKFITEDYYYAILSKMLADNKDAPYSDLITSIDNYDKRLEGFFSASLSTSMNSSVGYQKLNQYFYPKLYFKNVIELKSYAKESDKWAEKLHQYLIYNETVHDQIDQFTHDEQSNMQNLVIMLNYFNQEKKIKMENKISLPYMNAEAEDYYISYGCDIYYNVLNHVLVLNSYKFNFSNSLMNASERKVFYDNGFKKIIENVYTKEELSDYEKEIKKAVDEAVEEKTIDSWNEAYGYLSLLFCEFEAVVSGTEKCTLKCLADFFDNHTTIKLGFRYASMLLCQTLMVVNQVLSYQNWDNLTDAQKVQTICSSIYTFVDCIPTLGNDIFDYMRGVKVGAEEASDTVNAVQKAFKPTTICKSNEITSITKKSSDFFKNLSASAKEMSMFSKIEGGILSALSFAVSVCDIINDKGVYNVAVYSLDITTAVINGIAFLSTVSFALFGNILLGMTAFASLLPGIGFVCTLVGILFSFITFIVKKYTKTVEELYIENNCVPFVKKLEVPKDNNIIDLKYDIETNTFSI